MMRILSKYLFIPLLEKKTSGSTFKCLKELEQTQWLSKDELNQLQQKRLQYLIAHAYENVPFYQRTFQERGLTPDDVRTVEDLSKLPVLTKQDIRDNFEQMIAQNYDRKQMKLGSTGGSTGEPMKFLKPKDAGWREGPWYRGLAWYGFKPGDKWAAIKGGSISVPFPNTLTTMVSRFIRRQIFYSASDLSEKQVERIIDKLKRFKPKMIHGYPSAVYILAEHICQHGIQDIRPGVVITTAEKLYDYQRQTIEEAFGCDIFEHYGCGEVESIAYECPKHQGYHITTENVVLEVIRDDSQPALPGEAGRTIVTDLYNYAMPIIRYENGDTGILSSESCTCGRSLPILKSVEGRITDLIMLDHGYISTPSLTLIFKDLPVKQYQIIQESRDEILIKTVKRDGYGQKDTDYILTKMREYTGENVKIQIEFVDSIPTTQMGKRRVVISKVPGVPSAP